jgi:monoterpene epsilon-lactone hydrolase
MLQQEAHVHELRMLISPPFVFLSWFVLLPVHVRMRWRNLCWNLRLSWTNCRCTQSQRGELAICRLCPPRRVRHSMTLFVLACHRIPLLFALSLIGLAGFAQNSQRSLPAHTIPIPTTVSPELQKANSPPCEVPVAAIPRTNQQWKAFVRKSDAEDETSWDHFQKKFHVSVEEGKLGGVRVYDVKPEVLSEENRGRVLMHVHGGGYVSGGGRVAANEAVMMAHYGKIEVISVDYRMPPDFPFPAALEDSVAVWKEIIRTHTPNNAGIFGTSAGGGLALATVIRLKELGLPLPGALMAGTPWADLTKTGDTYYANEFVDNVLCTNDGVLGAAAKLYAGTHDLKEPLLSPIYGDLSGFPPTVLISGTRDLFLSNTVRVHQKLLQSGVQAELLVFEGQSHAQYLIAADAPESETAYREVADFFDRHLDK